MSLNEMMNKARGNAAPNCPNCPRCDTLMVALGLVNTEVGELHVLKCPNCAFKVRAKLVEEPREILEWGFDNGTRTVV